jgi:hypothetical protein
MAKPILVVRVPEGKFEKDLGKHISAGVGNQYHVLVVVMPNESEITFETFNTEAINSVDIKELKKAVFENNKKAKQKPIKLEAVD